MSSIMQTSLYASCHVRCAETALGLVAPTHTNFQQRQRPPVTARALGRPRKASRTPPDDASPSAAEPPRVAATAQPAAAVTPPARPAAAKPSFNPWHEYEEPLRIIPSIGEAAEAALVAAGMTKAGDLQCYYVETACGERGAMKQFLKGKGIARQAQIIDWLARVCPITQEGVWITKRVNGRALPRFRAAAERQSTRLSDISGLGKKSLLLLLQQDISSSEQLLEEFYDKAGEHLWVMKQLLKSYGIRQTQPILEWLAGQTGMSMSDAEDPMEGPLGSVAGMGLKAVLAMHAADISTVCDLQLEYIAGDAVGDPQKMKEILKNIYGVTQPDIVMAWLDDQDYGDNPDSDDELTL